MVSRRVGECRRLWIEGPAGRLEAALRVALPDRGIAVVAHPHPLHGGTLHNPVVFHADRELNRAGWTTLRFNFRGVGASEGVHDDGRGEADDVGAALAWLRGLAPAAPRVLVGFSFGSVCCIRHAAGDPGIAAVLAIGLPVRVYDLGELTRLRSPLAVVQAEHDEFGTPGEVERRLERAGVIGSVRTVPGTSHLFPGRAPDAGKAVTAAVEAVFPSLRPGRAPW